jgi:hypothetical protein
MGEIRRRTERARGCWVLVREDGDAYPYLRQ